MNVKDKIRTLISAMGLLTKDEIELIVGKMIIDKFPKDTFLLKEGQILIRIRKRILDRGK